MKLPKGNTIIRREAQRRSIEMMKFQQELVRLINQTEGEAVKIEITDEESYYETKEVAEFSFGAELEDVIEVNDMETAEGVYVFEKNDIKDIRELNNGWYVEYKNKTTVYVIIQ